MPELPPIYQEMFNQALTLHRAGRVRDALTLYQQVASRRPNNAQVMGMLGAAQMNLGKADEARRSLERAIKLEPGRAQFHHDLALTFKLLGDFEHAHRSIDTAIKLDPRSTAYRAAKAELFALAGENALAMQALEPAMRSGSASSPVALIFARLCGSFDKQQEGLALLEACLAGSGLLPAVRTKLLFAMGDLLDNLKRYDQAMEAYRQANASKAAVFDQSAHSAAVDRIVAAWSKAAMDSAAQSNVQSELPVFVLGMPRSGTTLVEQILGSLPGVHAVGELDDMLRIAAELDSTRVNGLPMITDPGLLSAMALTRQARSHLTKLQRMNGRATRIVDKMPMNFLVLGLISRLFPKARVIHCVRNPVDTCLSCYFHQFNGNLAFAYDLANLGAFYCDYERLMSHWKTTLDVPMLDVVYEDLVNVPEAGSRRIAEFIDVKWDPECLKFHESGRISLTSSNDQVRQPVYRSAMGRWKRYESHLGPLLNALPQGSHAAG